MVTAADEDDSNLTSQHSRFTWFVSEGILHHYSVDMFSLNQNASACVGVGVLLQLPQRNMSPLWRVDLMARHYVAENFSISAWLIKNITENSAHGYSQELQLLFKVQFVTIDHYEWSVVVLWRHPGLQIRFSICLFGTDTHHKHYNGQNNHFSSASSSLIIQKLSLMLMR